MMRFSYFSLMKNKEICDIEQRPIEAQFKWKIANFFAVIKDENVKCYISESYKFEGINFHFKLHPRSHPFPGYMNICLNFDYWQYNAKCSVIEYNYGFETQNNSIEKVIRGILRKEINCAPYIFKLSEIEERKSELAPSDVITIICKLKCHPPSSQPEIPQEPKRKKLKKLDTLSANFKSLFVNKESCDVTLQVMDKEYKAHSIVLMARSPVFAAMFLYESFPKQTNMITRSQKKKFQKMVFIPSDTIAVSDCDSESFELFLKYLYSGEVEELSMQTALHLYEISIKYKVWELQRLCIEFLNENLTVENLFDVGIIADKYHDIVLFSATYNFFCRKIDEILNTPVWDSFVESNFLLSKRYYKGKKRT